MNAHQVGGRWGGRGHLGTRLALVLQVTQARANSYLEVGESSFQFLYLQFEGVISLNLAFCVSQPCNKVTERIMECLSTVREVG